MGEWAYTGHMDCQEAVDEYGISTERECVCDPRFTPIDPAEPCTCGGFRA